MSGLQQCRVPLVIRHYRMVSGSAVSLLLTLSTLHPSPPTSPPTALFSSPGVFDSLISSVARCQLFLSPSSALPAWPPSTEQQLLRCTIRLGPSETRRSEPRGMRAQQLATPRRCRWRVGRGEGFGRKRDGRRDRWVLGETTWRYQVFNHSPMSASRKRRGELSIGRGGEGWSRAKSEGEPNE